MERTIISKENLANLFARNEIEAAALLRDALMDVKEKIGEITDPAIKNYNATENEYLFNISLTTIKNYSEKYGYSIFNISGDGCVVKQFSVNKYREIKKILDKNDDEKMEPASENKMSVAEKLALDYVKKAELYKTQKQMSIRFATSVQDRLDNLCNKYPMFTRQYLISLLFDTALSELGE